MPAETNIGKWHFLVNEEDGFAFAGTGSAALPYCWAGLAYNHLGRFPMRLCPFSLII